MRLGVTVEEQQRRPRTTVAHPERRLPDVHSSEVEAWEELSHAAILFEKIAPVRALVTGGASGIGAATVRRLRRDGMLAAALGGLDVVVACAPGPTTTPLLEAYFALSADPALEQARYAEAQVHGRLIEPEEIADAIAYLASPGASSTIGAALVVDGGYSIR